MVDRINEIVSSLKGKGGNVRVFVTGMLAAAACSCRGAANFGCRSCVNFTCERACRYLPALRHLWHTTHLLIARPSP